MAKVTVTLDNGDDIVVEAQSGLRVATIDALSLVPEGREAVEIHGKN